MRILFASLGMPFPPTNGHRMRKWALLRALGEEGHDVTLVSFAEPQDLNMGGSVLQKVCQTVDFVPMSLTSLSNRWHYLDLLLALVSPLPYGAWRFRSAAFTSCLRRHLARQPFDLVICDEVYNLPNLPRSSSVPVLLDTLHIAYMLLARYVTHERNLLKRVYAWIEYRKMRRWEVGVCSRLAGLMACSKLEREAFEELCPHVPVTMVPNVVDVDSYTPVSDRGGATVLYIGGMDWYPNLDAVEFFVSAILPELRILVPGVKFVVTFSPERAPTAKWRQRFVGLPAVDLTPSSDIRGQIAEAAIFVVPIRIASGTRFKILEAAAMAKPIVSTRIGAEGLDFVDREEILIADEPRTFAQAVANLLSDAYLRQSLGQAARRRVEQQYSFAVLRTAMRHALAQVC